MSKFKVGDKVIECDIFSPRTGEVISVESDGRVRVKIELSESFSTEALFRETELALIAVALPKGADPTSQWKEEGKCPKCGELGSFCPRTWVPVCSTHGPY